MNEPERQLLVVCFRKLLHEHRWKNAWNGQWSIDDCDCIDEDIITFKITSNMYENPEELMTAYKADLKAFANQIINKFRINGFYPAYLKHFFDKLNNETVT